jgi:glutathione S-transferase
MTPLLWSIPYSPWSERARFALDYAGAPYEKRTYKPLFGELALRRALGRWRGPVSVPILQTGAGVLEGGFAIAEHAEAHGKRSVLPREHRDDVVRWDERASAAMSAGRACALERTLTSRGALIELAPKRLRSMPGTAALTRAGIERTIRKYRPVTPTNPGGFLEETLLALREALEEGHATEGVRHLLPTFGYADISVAQVLAFVEPPSDGLRLGEANRQTYRDGRLAERYRDLVRWRDRLYAHFRRIT